MNIGCWIGYSHLGMIEHIYCENNGTPEGVLALLRQHYTDEDNVHSLVELGDIHTLGDNLSTTVAYHRDLNESYEHQCSDPSCFFGAREVKYKYVFSCGTWHAYYLSKEQPW